MLVIGGFFHIQTMQKVAQIGVLKAIGASSGSIAFSSIVQIFSVNRMTRWVDKVIRMTDGNVAQIIESKGEIEAYSRGSEH